MSRLFVALLGVSLVSHLAAADYSWATAQAEVDPSGDLSWAPHEFVYEAGDTVRYIDYADGDDANPGTREQPWKHHPWDAAAGGRAAAYDGPTTYVFKRGVTYRGELEDAESGTPADPMRLTSDPSWGEGEARFYGSRQVVGWQQGAHPDMPDDTGVWYADIDWTPRHVWMLDGEESVTQLKLARTPNWDRHANPRSPEAEWFRWENPKWWEGDPVKTTIDGRKMHLGVDTQNLTRDPDYYEGALVWTQWGTMMGAPYASTVKAYDAKRKAIAYQGPWHRDSGTIRTDHAYYLEDKPHYLDQAGEFWFDRKGKGGRLYVRLPEDRDPNSAIIEAADVVNFIDGTATKHLHVSGLVFRFGNVHYDLTARFFQHDDVNSAVVRVRQGDVRDIQVRNCVFEYVSNAVQLGRRGMEGNFTDILIADNLIRFTDHHAVAMNCPGKAHRIRVMRNRMHENGRRAIRPNGNFTVNLVLLHSGEIAGNIITRAYAAGINVTGGRGGKTGKRSPDEPFVRILIHHNKVVDSLLSANDWGGIETWQQGPIYIYNNVSGNPVGPFHGKTFGFAYYLDGGFKNYLFNNIAWGRDNDPEGFLPNFSAFQEIHSYQNTFFNNTAYRFMYGTRRQAPQAGRDKFLGNVFQDISVEVFKHTDSKNENPNAKDAGEQKKDFAYYTNAYARNVMHGLGGWIGSFHALGGKYDELEAYVAALAEVQPLSHDVGVVSEEPPLRDPANGDFRLTEDSPAIDNGVRVFVPWALHSTVGEWNFTPRSDDPSQVIDENFVLTSYHVNRSDYYQRPMNPLQGHGIGDADFVAGPLENWTRGALRLDGAQQYLAIDHAKMTEPFHFTTKPKKGPEQEQVAQGAELFTPDIHESDFLIEAYLQITDGDAGVLVRKRDAETGYELRVTEDGTLRLELYQGGELVASRASSRGIADGDWHHVVAEVERGDEHGLRLSIDGSSANGPGEGAAPGGTLANGGDFLVGGGPELDHLACTLEFLRVCRGTLEAADTDVAELHAWQFAGPHLRDFTGREPVGARDAGAIESR